MNTNPIKWWSYVGFVSRPEKGEKAAGDFRGAEIYGRLELGETCIYVAERTKGDRTR